jgi:peptidylprolyl isomerase
MARKRERFFAIFVALLFLITTVGGTGILVWQMIRDGKTNTTANSSNTSGKKLEGTMLDNFTPVAKIDTLHWDDTKVGTGDEIKASDSITADYTGAVASTGKIFQSSLDTNQPFTSPLSGLIQGWQQGIPGMKVGGTRRLYIPSALAYGDQAKSGIPANSDLVFDITVHSIGGK